jgi:hypothetical protein
MGIGLGEVSLRKKNVMNHAKTVNVAGTAQGRK